MYIIKYQAGDRFHFGRQEIVGCLSYYADLADATKHHTFVRTIVSWTDEPQRDYLGKPFKMAPPGICH